MNINNLKLHASYLRQIIDSRKKRKKHILEEYARLIWLIDSKSRKHDLAN